MTIYRQVSPVTGAPNLTHHICQSPTDEQVKVALQMMEAQEKKRAEAVVVQPVNLIEADKHPNWSWLQLFQRMSR